MFSIQELASHSPFGLNFTDETAFVCPANVNFKVYVGFWKDWLFINKLSCLCNQCGLTYKFGSWITRFRWTGDCGTSHETPLSRRWRLCHSWELYYFIVEFNLLINTNSRLWELEIWEYSYMLHLTLTYINDCSENHPPDFYVI